ncbi:VWA domain-containing protein [bacterium]|nr:VWA domain-containing protein [bacterium]
MAKKATLPSFDFDLQLMIWQGVARTWGWLRRDPGERRRTAAGVPLSEERARLQSLARAISGLPLLVRATHELPGCDGRHLLLPERVAWFEEPDLNRLTLRLLAIALAEVAAAGRILDPGDAPRLDPLELGRARAAFSDYPGLREALEVYERAEEARLGRSAWAPVPEGGELPALCYRLLPRARGLATDLSAPGQEAEASGELSEAEATVQEGVERVELSKEEREQPPPHHNFEKVETLDEFRGIVRDLDGSDELEAELDAMRELKMGHVIRVDDPAHAIYRAELLMDDQTGEVASAQGEGIPYDEWDAKKKAYRKAWCRIRVSRCDAREPEWYAEQRPKHADAIRRLKRAMERAVAARDRRWRQPEGPELDLGAVIEQRVRLLSGQAPNEEIYLDARRPRRELAVLVLLDLSLSTDAYVDGRRVLDVCKESLLVLAEVCNGFGDAFEIAGFSSNTRNQVDYRVIKAFSDAWSAAAPLIGPLEPRGYTRIGPALRHATRRLAKQAAKHRVILLLSDGKPNDFDRYEGRYGIGDIRQAVREAEREGVRVHALAVDKQASDYLPHMLGGQRFSVLRHPDELAGAMSQLIARLASRG